MSTRGKKNKSTKSRGLGGDLLVRCVGFCGIDDSVNIDDVIQFAKEHGDIAELAVLFRREMEVSDTLCYVIMLSAIYGVLILVLYLHIHRVGLALQHMIMLRNYARQLRMVNSYRLLPIFALSISRIY